MQHSKNKENNQYRNSEYRHVTKTRYIAKMTIKLRNEEKNIWNNKLLRKAYERVKPAEYPNKRIQTVNFLHLHKANI